MSGLALVPVSDSQRLDKWLWMARFYKTRPLAVEAIRGGHVHLNGARAKPATAVRPGDELTLSKGASRWRLTVAALATRRGPAVEAQRLYTEDPASVAQRAAQRQTERLSAPSAPRRRPDKRQRRRIIRFVNKHAAGD